MSAELTRITLVFVMWVIMIILSIAAVVWTIEMYREKRNKEKRK